MNFAPIIIFAFHRLHSLEKCVRLLLDNDEAHMSDLYVYVDGARSYEEGEESSVSYVRKFVKSIKGFHSLHYVFSDIHKGLAPSVIDGVSKVINQYGKAIVVEDDLMVSSNFLAFMNKGLECYECNKRVFSICGYSNKVICPKDYNYNTYFCTRSSSWGWGTWKDRWNSVDWNLADWDAHKANAKEFNKWGGSDCWKLLNDWHNGRNSSWAIRFSYAQFLHNSLSLFPLISKVCNNGLDGRGTHFQRWSRFKSDFDIAGDKDFRFPVEYTINKSLYKQVLSYHSISIRLWSRIMYLLHRRRD